jgi:hypothetical protein
MVNKVGVHRAQHRPRAQLTSEAGFCGSRARRDQHGEGGQRVRFATSPTVFLLQSAHALPKEGFVTSCAGTTPRAQTLRATTTPMSLSKYACVLLLLLLLLLRMSFRCTRRQSWFSKTASSAPHPSLTAFFVYPAHAYTSMCFRNILLRYISGDYRFSNGCSKGNPRKMVIIPFCTINPFLPHCAGCRSKCGLRKKRETWRACTMQAYAAPNLYSYAITFWP